MLVAKMRIGSVIWGLSSLLHKKLCPWCTARWQTCCRGRCRCYECFAYSIWWLLDSLVCHALRLGIGVPKTFWMPWNMWDVPRAESSISGSCPCWEVSDLWQVLCYKMEENISATEHVLRMSGYYNHLNQVGVNLPDKIVIDRVL